MTNLYIGIEGQLEGITLEQDFDQTIMDFTTAIQNGRLFFVGKTDADERVMLPLGRITHIVEKT